MVGDNWSQEGDLLTPGMLAIPSPATEVTRLHVDVEGAQDHSSQSARQTDAWNLPGLAEHRGETERDVLYVRHQGRWQERWRSGPRDALVGKDICHQA